LVENTIVSMVKWFSTSSFSWRIVGSAHQALSVWLSSIGSLQTNSDLCDIEELQSSVNSDWFTLTESPTSLCVLSKEGSPLLSDTFTAFSDVSFFLTHSSLFHWKEYCAVQENSLEIGVPNEYLLSYQSYTSKLEVKGYTCTVYGSPDYGLQIECLRGIQKLQVYSFYQNRQGIPSRQLHVNL
jgi:hypothetical protein